MKQQTSYPVIGIGASAGGLEAMSTLLDVEPALHGMALLIVQHLDPKGESHLVDLLSRHTSLTVQPARDGMRDSTRSRVRLRSQSRPGGGERPLAAARSGRGAQPAPPD